MHLSLPATLALAAAASACYSGGQAWGNSREEAQQLANEACRLWTQNDPYFKGGENKYMCGDLGGNVRVDFRMRNGDDGGPSRYLDYDTCVASLHSQINNCNFGGEYNQGAWRPRSDPNVGSC